MKNGVIQICGRPAPTSRVPKSRFDDTVTQKIFALFDSTVGSNNAKIFWVTVSSKRDFGTRLVGAGRPQIWMTPFFIDQASAGMDPSVAAFRLPFQDITSNNHIAQWTERVV